MICGGIGAFLETSSSEGVAIMDRNRPVDITALSLLCAFGALLCTAAAVMIPSADSVPHSRDWSPRLLRWEHKLPLGWPWSA